MRAVAEAAAFGALALAAHVGLGLKLVEDLEPRAGPAQTVLTLRAVPDDLARYVADWERRPNALQQISRPAAPAVAAGDVPVPPKRISAPGAVRHHFAIAGPREADPALLELEPHPRRPRPLMLTVRRAASVPAPPPPVPRRRSDRPDREGPPTTLPMPNVADTAPGLAVTP